MSAMIPFNYDGRMVRVLDRRGEPWFVLADVCRELDIGNPSDAARRLDDDEKMILDLADGRVGDTLDTIEGIADPRVQALIIVNESGLYSLIFTSRKPEAKRFKRWVTHEVLPSIRKTGAYVMPGDGSANQQRVEAVVLAELERLSGAVARFGTESEQRILVTCVLSTVCRLESWLARQQSYLDLHAEKLGRLAEEVRELKAALAAAGR